MSLIERALGKARDGTKSNRPAPLAQRPVVSSNTQRLPAIPQLELTPEIQARLGLSAPPEQQHQRASEYRHIKRRVLADMGNAKNRIVLVASALAGEGKSFTSANLARSLAMEPDYTVLLVDADVVKPALSHSMEVQEKPGLMNALIDPSVDPESLVLTTNIEGLSVLPAGGANANATEYFASDRMRQVLDALLSVPNRIVVVDSLPLLLTTEARVLPPLAGQVLLVVRSESTPQSAVVSAMELLGEDVIAGVVLNAVVRTRMSRYLGYGYGFDYEYSWDQAGLEAR